MNAKIWKDEQTGAIRGTKKFKFMDSISRAHNFCMVMESGELSPEEAVEEFKPEHAWTDKLNHVFVFSDNSYVTQTIVGAQTHAYDRNQVPERVVN